MRITLIQPVQNKLYDFDRLDCCFSPDEARQLQAGMIEQTFSLMDESSPADLVVTTEAVNYPGPLPDLVGQDDSAALIDRFADYARRRHCYVAACLYQRRKTGLYNTVQVFDRDGNIAAVYDKIHLAGGEKSYLVPGQQYCTVEADFGRFGVCICWDMQFPEVCRHYALQGMPLVICPTWGWESIYAHARAYENGIWVAGAMSVPYHGIIEGIRTPSEVVAPDGNVVAAARMDVAQALTCDIDLSIMRDLHHRRMTDRMPQTYGALCQV